MMSKTTAKKTVTKKTATKPTKKPVEKQKLPFDKKGVLALADFIYTERPDRVSFAKLCDGTLKMSNGSTKLHCAIGEAYNTFVSSDMRSLYDADHDEGDAFDKAVKKLMSVAKLRDKGNAPALERALRHMSEINDDGSDLSLRPEGISSDDLYRVRAKEVAQAFRAKIAPHLK